MKTSLPPFLSERHKTVIHLREVCRATFLEIGERLAVTRSRAHAIYQQGVYRRDHTPECIHGLTWRSVHILEMLCLENREEVLAAVVSGRLTARRGLRNHGRQTQIEIESWLGLLKP
jgi:hypothetical protein